MPRLVLLVSSLVLALGLAPAASHANGSYSHVHISQLAVEKLSPGPLRDLLEDPLNVPKLEAGSLFPDGGYAVGNDYGEIAHWSQFLNFFIAQLRDKYGGDYSSTAAQEEVAFLMGVAAHGLADQTYDTTILARAFEVDGDPGSVDQEADYFIIVDQHVLLDTQAWAPYPDLVSVFQNDIGYSVSEATLEAGMTAMEAAVALQRSTALQQYQSAWRHYPWLGTHVYDERAPGSLPHLAELVQRHWQVVWKRLQFDGDFDQDAVIAFVPEMWQDAFPVDASGGAANFRIGILFGYGIARSQAAPFIELLDDADQPVPFSLRTPYNGDIRNYMWLEPTTALEHDREYRVVLRAGIQNNDGVATAVDHVRSFRTRCASAGPGCAEIPPPLVTGETPSSSVCGVADGRERQCKHVITARKGLLRVEDGAADARDSLFLRWTGGEDTRPFEFSDPFTTDGPSVCLWAGAEESKLEKVYEASIPAGGACDGRACWQSIKDGYRFRDRSGSNRGIAEVLLKGGNGGRARLLVQGEGGNLDLPPLPLVPNGGLVRAQIRNQDVCWEANFSTSIAKNDGASFVAQSEAEDVVQPAPEVPPDAVCRARKEIAAGKYAHCLADLRAAEITSGQLRDTLFCSNRLTASFERAERKAVATCASRGDAPATIATVGGCVDTIVADVFGGAPTPGDAGARARCDAGKVRAIGNYYICWMRAQAKATSRDVFVDPTAVDTCDAKLIAAVEKSNTKDAPCSTSDDAASLLATARACPLDFSGSLARTGFFGMTCDLGIAAIPLGMSLTVTPQGRYRAGAVQSTSTQLTVEIGESLVGTLQSLGATEIQLDSANAVTVVTGAAGAPVVNEVEGVPLTLDLTVDTDVPPNGIAGPVIVGSNVATTALTPDGAATTVDFELDTVAVEVSMVPVLGALSLACTQDAGAGNVPISFELP